MPLFVLMASILERAGIAEDLFDAMSIFAGKFRGGVAIQTIAVAVVLAAMSGVMGGEIVMLGLVPASAFKTRLRSKNVYRSNLRFRCSGDTHPSKYNYDYLWAVGSSSHW